MWALGAGLYALPHVGERSNEIADIHVEEVALDRIDVDSAEFQLHIGGTASKSVTLKAIYCEQVTVNGMAVRILPVRGPVRFREKQEIAEFPPLRAVVSFRDVPTLRPLRDMIRDGRARIQATILAEIALNPLQILAVRSTNAWAELTLDQEQPVELPGGLLGKTAAFAALTAAEPVWVMGNEGRAWRERHSTFYAKAQEALGNSIVSVDCSFEIRGQNGTSSGVHHRSAGVILPSGRILTTAEAIEPWDFDAAMAAALNRHEIELVAGSPEITVGVRTMAKEFSTARNEVRILGGRGGKQHMISGGMGGSYRLRLRNTDDNFALIELEGFQPPARNSAWAQVAAGAAWQTAAVFQVNQEPSVLLTEVRQENGRNLLKEAASPTALGSPVWVEGGIVGLLQDVDSAIDIRIPLKAFPAERF